MTDDEQTPAYTPVVVGAPPNSGPAVLHIWDRLRQEWHHAPYPSFAEAARAGEMVTEPEAPRILAAGGTEYIRRATLLGGWLWAEYSSDEEDE